MNSGGFGHETTGMWSGNADAESIFATGSVAAGAVQLAAYTQWTQLLQQMQSLQQKVVELEDWKSQTVEDMRQLNVEHKQLRSLVLEKRDSHAHSKKLWPHTKHESQELTTLFAPTILLSELVPGEAFDEPVLPLSRVASAGGQTSPCGSTSPGDQRDSLTVTSRASTPGSGSETPGRQGSISLLAPPGLMSTQAVPKMMASAALTRSPPPGLPPPPPGPPALTRAATAPAEYDINAHVGTPEAVHVAPITINGGRAVMRGEWRIGSLKAKLKGSMGRPLVSPPFAVNGLRDLRLMVYPDAKEVVKGPRNRSQKEQYAAMINQGPLHGALRLKVAELGCATLIRFHLTIGTIRCGPFEYDAFGHAVHGCDDFGVDWLEHVEESGCLLVGVEIEEICAVSSAEAISAAAAEEVLGGELSSDEDS